MRKLTRFSSVVFVLLAVGCLSGCSSPEYRIKKNPEMFASFPLDVQEKVQQGQVDIGFTGDMVIMALGEPNRKYSRQTSASVHEVWSYTYTSTKTDRQRVQTDVRYRDDSGKYRTSSEWSWVDVPRETEHERIRIEFTDGKVSAIESLQK